MAYTNVQWAVFIALVVLAGLELYKIIDKVNQKYLRLGKTESITLFVSSWAIVATLILMTPSIVRNYHTQHTEHTETSEHKKVHDE